MIHNDRNSKEKINKLGIFDNEFHKIGFWKLKDHKNIIKKFMTESSVKVIEQPAKSHDFKIIEDIWSIIFHGVHDIIPYRNLTELEERISQTILDHNLSRRQNSQYLYATIRNSLYSFKR